MIETDLPTAGQICRGVLRLLSEHGYAGVTEMTLANSRRADVAAVGRDGKVIIVEIKSSVADFRADHKWPEYVEYCDQFFFAVDERFPLDLIPELTGLIVADGFGGAFLRRPKETKLSPARRKALTLRFARLAANRLNQTALQT